MSNIWTKSSQAWLAFTRREKVLLVVTALALPFALMFVLMIEPALKTLDGIDQAIRETEGNIASQQIIIQALQNAEKPDPDEQARNALNALAMRLNSVQEQISQFSQQLVSPSQMMQLLHSILDADSGLEIKSAKSLEAVPIRLQPPETEASPQTKMLHKPAIKGLPSSVMIVPSQLEAPEEPVKQEALVYKHAFEVELEGSYTALYNYLLSLEALHQGFFFEYLEFETGTYPKARILLRVHTLSIDEGWIGA